MNYYENVRIYVSFVLIPVRVSIDSKEDVKGFIGL